VWLFFAAKNVRNSRNKAFSDEKLVFQADPDVSGAGETWGL
jgi:hypothetical protein